MGPKPLATSFPDLKSARLRTNPAYELVLFDRLPPEQQLALHAQADDPECYGILRSHHNSDLPPKSVSRDTALLLFSLHQPGPLPHYAAQALGAGCETLVATMVLDGVLQVEINGQMISGPSAAAYLTSSRRSEAAETTLAAVSRRAVAYGAALQFTSPDALSARLYAYNCLPASARWRSLLPGEKSTAHYLGLVDGPAARVLAGHWRRLPETQSWLSWRNGSAKPEPQPASTGTYKLYVSPACDKMREVAAAVAAAVAPSGAVQWKVGKGPSGLLRPDKMVIYFHRFPDLQQTALALLQSLQGCPAHGVPFTAELGGDGLLSWGIDSPTKSRSATLIGAWSWRAKICDRLALALVQAGPSNGDAAAFALERLRLEGIDTATWTPRGLPKAG